MGSGSGTFGDDAGVGGHGGNGEADDKTNFYTCASCGASGGDLPSGLVMITGVAIVLRRRRRA